MTASEIRFEESMAQQARLRLTRFPELQAEAIAKHYATHALLALDLLRMVDSKRRAPVTGAYDQVIEHMVRELRRAHLADFGIPLEWKEAACRE